MFKVRVRAATLVTLAAAGAACSDRATAPAPDTTPITSTTVPERPRVPAEPSAQVLREVRVYANPAPLGAIQEEYGIAPVILDPGTYTFDELGIDVTLTLPDFWRVEVTEPGKFDLTRPEAELQSLLPGVIFLRPLGFADPLRAGGGTLFPGSSGWEAWDLGEWIEAMPQLVVLDQGDVTIDGRPTRWWDIDVDPALGLTDTRCQPGSCVSFMTTGGSGTMVARDLERIRWYEIPDPLGQIVVFVAGRDEEWDDLVADADEIVRSIRLGPSVPHPVPDDLIVADFMAVNAGTNWRFSGVDGLTFETPTRIAVTHRPGELRQEVRDQGATVSFVLPTHDADGNPLSTTADVLATLERYPDTTIVDRDAVILDRPAVLADVITDDADESTSPPAFLLSAPRPGFDTRAAAWPSLPHNRVWVVDTPIGPALVAASAESSELLDDALGTVDFFTDGLGFCAETDSCPDER